MSGLGVASHGTTAILGAQSKESLVLEGEPEAASKGLRLSLDEAGLTFRLC